jgi:hypothetical protein
MPKRNTRPDHRIPVEIDCIDLTEDWAGIGHDLSVGFRLSEVTCDHGVKVIWSSSTHSPLRIVGRVEVVKLRTRDIDSPPGLNQPSNKKTSPP